MFGQRNFLKVGHCGVFFLKWMDLCHPKTNDHKMLLGINYSMKSIHAVLLTLYSAFCLADAPSETPNIVLIVADHMGASDVGAYGATDIETPSLDALAAQGARYTNYYAAAPICGPSRAAMMTGKYPARIGFEDNIDHGSGLSSSIPTLPKTNPLP